MVIRTEQPTKCLYQISYGGEVAGVKLVYFVACFGVRVSVVFHLMLVHYTFSTVWVAEWPPYRK